MSIAGKTIVITGATGGLGEALVRAALAAGARVVMSDVDAARGAALEKALASDRLRFVACDLGDPGSIEAFAANVQNTEGVVHGLINNGAIATGIGGPEYDTLKIDVFDAVMRVNVRGSWLMTRALAPMLIASGAGRIVNVASDTALWGAPRLLAYVASKGAVMAMTRSLARELGPKGVGVTVVAPGIMRTPSTEYVPAERHALYENGRAVPGPQDAADVVGVMLFLLSRDALAVTGQTIPVNAGFVFT